MAKTLYYIIREELGAYDKVIGSEVISVYENKSTAIEWAEAYIQNQIGFEQWGTPTAKRNSPTEWELYYSRRHTSNIRVKSTTKLSADQIYKTYNVDPSKEDIEALQKQLKTSSTQSQSTQIINNQKQNPMANNKQFKHVSYNKSSKDSYGRVIGNPYQFTNNGKMYQAVPEQMVSLPKGNHFIIAKKHVNLGGQFNNQATYVLGYSNLKGERQSGKTRRIYFVARLIWRGGNPALALYRYMGYDYQLAKDVFSEIAYDSAEYLNRDGKFVPYRVKSMTAKDIVASKLKKQEALERMKTAAYGDKAARKAYAQAHKSKYPRVK